MKPRFFFDYIFYRMTKWYYKWDGKEGVTAAYAIALLQLILVVDVVLLVRKLFLQDYVSGFPRPLGYVFAVIVFIVCWYNERKYKHSYSQLQEYWHNESSNQQYYKGLLVICSILAPILLGLLIGSLPNR